MCNRKLFAFMLLIGCSIAGHAATLIPEEASRHINENATVCGLVASANYAVQAPTAPTFLNFGKPYPDQSFTAVIFESDRPKFGTPEIAMREKQVCVTGAIFLFEGKPAMIVRDPNQLQQR